MVFSLPHKTDPRPPTTPRFSNWSGDAKPSLMIARQNHEGSSDSKTQIYYDSVKIELSSRFHENLCRVRLRSKLLTNASHFIKSWKYAQQLCYLCPYNVLQPLLKTSMTSEITGVRKQDLICTGPPTAYVTLNSSCPSAASGTDARVKCWTS